MRKIIVTTFITLDGVMQAPGGPDEDTADGFAYGGWTAPYTDDVLGKAMQDQMKPADLLLGRKTFDIFERYWPAHAEGWPCINEVTKYVLSGTRQDSSWRNVVFLQDIADVARLKETDGPDIKVWGSSVLVQSLLQADLVDELWLKIYPVTLGKGKKLFEDAAIPAAFILTDGVITPGGVIVANYRRAGEVQTGTVGE